VDPFARLPENREPLNRGKAMLMTWIYRLLVAGVTVLLVLELFRQKDLKTQATAAFVMIPFVLRTLMLV
jgi:hypothetical protein